MNSDDEDQEKKGKYLLFKIIDKNLKKQNK